MTTPKKPDRTGLYAALTIWAVALAGTFLFGLEVTETAPKRWLGHWITNIWAFIGWLPVLLFLRREPQPPEDRQ